MQFGDRLTDREKQVITMRYGLHDGTLKTLEEVAQALGKRVGDIGQLQLKAQQKLRLKSPGNTQWKEWRQSNTYETAPK